MAIGFDKSNIGELTATQKPAKGYHALLVIAAERHQSEKNDNIMGKLTMKILTDPEDGNSVKGMPISTWLTFPVKNLDVEGHKVENWMPRMACDAMSAFFPGEVFAFPRAERGTGKLLYKGEYIDREDERECRKEALLSCVAKTQEVWGEEGENLGPSFVNERIFAELYYDKKNPDFPSLRNFNATCPEDWELSTEVIQLDVEDEKKTKKAAKKKTAKKKTSRRKR
jgi:hypothetical protein